MRPWVVWVIALGLCAVVNGLAVTGWLLLRHHHAAGPIVYSPTAHPTVPWQGSPPAIDTDEAREPDLPRVKRQVPLLDARVLDGCSRTDLDSVESSIQHAINKGAPLYNDGDFDGCYKTYEAAALSIERVTPKACRGPSGVLKTGRERAAKLDNAAAQAWAMRDAFDGLLDVIDRKGTEL